MALQDPIGDMQKRAVDAWMEAIAVRQWLEWFWREADFGPADGDVRQMLEDQYEKETGRTIPQNWKNDTGE